MGFLRPEHEELKRITREYPVNRYWRDSGLLPIGEGTSEIQRGISARRILGER